MGEIQYYWRYHVPLNDDRLKDYVDAESIVEIKKVRTETYDDSVLTARELNSAIEDTHRKWLSVDHSKIFIKYCFPEHRLWR